VSSTSARSAWLLPAHSGLVGGLDGVRTVREPVLGHCARVAHAHEAPWPSCWPTPQGLCPTPGCVLLKPTGAAACRSQAPLARARRAAGAGLAGSTETLVRAVAVSAPTTRRWTRSASGSPPRYSNPRSRRSRHDSLMEPPTGDSTPWADVLPQRPVQVALPPAMQLARPECSYGPGGAFVP